ncbi:hypothetical protein FRC12_024822 [Ceratobasidium sp. 428]|nr:hypothetical protein FRC12_024822 [Ceratobasidium sp. 428]
MPPVVGTPPKEEGLSLAEEVERRAMAATAALKSPSTPRFTDAGTNGRKSSRKLNTRQISSPQLVSSTTSVDTIALGASNQASQPNLPHSASGPLPTVERAPQSSKLSQRIKKFTGNLRAKTPNPTGDEVSPYVIEASTPPATESSSPRQMPSFDPPTPTKPPLVTTPVGATDDSNSSAPGTPTSAPPRLRGFMARLRKGRKDSTDGRDKGIRAPSPLGPNAKPGTSPQQAPIPPPPHIPAAALRAETIPPPDNFSSSSLGGSGTDSPQNVPPPPPPPPSLPLSAPANIGTHPSSPPPQPHIQSQQGDEDAVRQLYDAALHLGLDRAVINDILVRSQSTSSRSTAWTQAQTPTTATISDPPTTPPPPALPASGLERSMSVTTPKAPRSGVMLGRQLSLKPFSPQSMLAPSAAAAPQSPSGGDGSSKASIVRRTIIFPSPSARSSPEVSRRPSTSKHRRSRSGSIHSNKSVQDRAPTPPPSRAPTNKRFSKDQSPPVPQLPSGLDGSVSAALQAPRTASGLGSVSNYDSLYDMYTENSGQPDSEAMQGDPAPTGSAVEVLELSDGQIIWSVVDGLRAAGQDDDEDDTSPFPYRMSRNSEYSMQETHELRFKEHHRTASKGSTLSAASKASKGPQSNRPETRVFFSNAGDIGQLIDNLSKSVEAGQFNILPGVPTVPNSYLRPQSGAHSAHSFNSSFNSSLPDGDWTVEERIDHMIAANRKRTGL